MIGAIIGGKYRVVRVIGQGGMGRVYEGLQQLGGKNRKVAIKTLHPHIPQDSHVEARFVRECGIIANLEHPNTIQLFDFGRAPNGSLFMVMEFVSGNPICEILKQNGPMPPDRVARIIRQVCGSLAEAHQKGIIHRDLKPDNIILTTHAGETDFAKVLDFGIAAHTATSNNADPPQSSAQRLTQEGKILGTPPYMSPEQFTGEQLDNRSDIYTIGVLAYEMLTGKLPFSANTPWEWATKHVNESPIPFDTRDVLNTGLIPQTMKHAIMRALEKNRDNRHPNALAFYNDFAGPTLRKSDPRASLSEIEAADTVPLDFGALAAMHGPAHQPPNDLAHAPTASLDDQILPRKPNTTTSIESKSKPQLIAIVSAIAALLAAATFVIVRQYVSSKPEPQITTGAKFTCVVAGSGSVKCWGVNEMGQLGNGSYEAGTLPATSKAGPIFTKLASGLTHTCALTYKGSVKCWGRNSNGQLGDGTITNRNYPTQIPELESGVVSIAAGDYHSCAITDAGTALCWGRNIWQQLGDNSIGDKTSPSTPVALNSKATAITAGRDHTCALTSQGAVMCWGDNSRGQLGNTTNTLENTPTKAHNANQCDPNTKNKDINCANSPIVPSGLDSGVLSISAREYRTCALTSNGEVKCWGYNNTFGLGGPSPDETATTPVTVLSEGIVAISVGTKHSCAITSKGAVLCWGSNEFGQLGDGTKSDRRTPTAVSGLESGTATVSAGYDHTCAITVAGRTMCWGRNDHGQLGDGAKTDRLRPVAAN